MTSTPVQRQQGGSAYRRQRQQIRAERCRWLGATSTMAIKTKVTNSKSV
jgi:hypothetical protein